MIIITGRFGLYSNKEEIGVMQIKDMFRKEIDREL